MKVFGTSLNVMVRQEDNVHQVICSLQVLNMLMDAHDILEPIFMDNQPTGSAMPISPNSKLHVWPKTCLWSG